jgi:nicotinamide mononucleotide transporter
MGVGVPLRMEKIWAYLVTNPVEIAGSLLTVWGIWLNTKQRVWGWVVNLAGIACYLYVFWVAKLYADVLLNIYFFASSVYGFYHWQFGGGQRRVLPVRATPARELAVLLGLGLAASLALGTFLDRQTDAALPYWDSAIAGFSLVAQWMLAQKQKENWLLWLGVNLVACGVYFYKDLWATTVVYALLLGLAWQGHRAWQRAYQAQANPRG